MTGKAPADLLHGTLDVLILKALAGGPLHGYAIARWIEQRTGGVFTIEDAALYKALHRLEAQRALASDWGQSETNRRAKYYQVTARGRRLLQSEARVWERYAGAVSAVLRSEER
jgi:transcriptional regulator